MRYEPREIKLRYTVKFEKTVYGSQKPNETHEDMIDRLADDLFYNNGEAIEGVVKDIDNVEEI